MCHDYPVSPIYKGEGCIWTPLKHQRTVNILAECNMRSMCKKVKEGHLNTFKYIQYKYLS